MSNYYVTKRVKCPYCDGTGWVENPQFRSLERDYPNDYARIADRYGIAEELECGDCDGLGIIVEEVNLEEALNVIQKR